MKESHGVQTAEFATAQGIEKEPAFAWWVPYTLQKRDVIVSAAKANKRPLTSMDQRFQGLSSMPMN
jgi:hypothetical protein